MIRLPFERLNSFEKFQSLCVDLLKLEGLNNVIAGGKGPDQGVDLFADVTFVSSIGEYYHKYIIQCKFKKPKNNVSEKEVGDIVSYLDLHNARGLLFITSSYFSGTAISKMEAINKSIVHPFNIIYWDCEELSRRIRKYPALINTYWYFNKNNYSDLPSFDGKELIKDYEVPTRFINYKIDEFPTTEYNQKIVENIKLSANEFIHNSIPVLIVDGAIYSGKTGLSCSIINEMRNLGKDTAYIDYFYFNETYFDYKLQGENYYLPFYNFIANVDSLVLDEFGKYLTEGSVTHKSAIIELKKLINDRISKKLKTIIITSNSYNLCSDITNYIKYLSKNYSNIYLGDFSINKEIKIQHNTLNNSTCYLGKAWLLEKYNSVLYDLNSIIEIIETPDEIYEANARDDRERNGGEERTKIKEILNLINEIIKSIEGYCYFIETLKFQAIQFDSDGKTNLIE